MREVSREHVVAKASRNNSLFGTPVASHLLLLPILHHDAEADGPADEDEREDDGPDAHARLGSNAGSGGATCRFGTSEPRNLHSVQAGRQESGRWLTRRPELASAGARCALGIPEHSRGDNLRRAAVVKGFGVGGLSCRGIESGDLAGCTAAKLLFLLGPRQHGKAYRRKCASSLHSGWRTRRRCTPPTSRTAEQPERSAAATS